MDLKTYADKKNNEIDILLFITILVLAGFGLAMVYSASAFYALNQFSDKYYFFKKQFIWLCAGFLLLFIFLNIDYHIYQKYTRIMLVLSIISLALLLVPGIGHEVKGSSRWLGLKSINIQPSRRMWKRPSEHWPPKAKYGRRGGACSKAWSFDTLAS